MLTYPIFLSFLTGPHRGFWRNTGIAQQSCKTQRQKPKLALVLDRSNTTLADALHSYPAFSTVVRIRPIFKNELSIGHNRHPEADQK